VQILRLLRLTPTGFILTRRPEEFLNVRFDQTEPYVSIKLLTAVVQNEARAAFYSHRVGVLIVRGKTGECTSIVDVSFNSGDVDADGTGYLTLDVPACNVPAVPKKSTAECPEGLFGNACRRTSAEALEVRLPIAGRLS